ATIENIDPVLLASRNRAKDTACCLWPNMISLRTTEEMIRVAPTSGALAHLFESEFLNQPTRDSYTHAASLACASRAICSTAAVTSGSCYSWDKLYFHGPLSRICRSTSCTTSHKRFRLWFRVPLSCTSPNAHSIGLARGQYVGNQSNVKRGGFVNTCSTRLSLL